MTVRAALVKIHLWLALISAIFLVILGLTGAIIAFENDIDHWLNPNLFYIHGSGQALSEGELIRIVDRAYAPARVAFVHIFRQPNLVHSMQLTDRSTVLTNPFDGRILGRIAGPSTVQKMVGYLHQIHTHLVPDPRSTPRLARIGGIIVQLAGWILCLVVPIGVILWWRAKRLVIRWKAPWFRVCFDAHQAIGIYAALFLTIAAITGVMVERGDLISWFTQSAGPSRFPTVKSSPLAGDPPVSVDRAEEIARSVIPATNVTDVQIPRNPMDVYMS
jgi:uncharacterized iron-regulated membrane protein